MPHFVINRMYPQGNNLRAMDCSCRAQTSSSRTMKKCKVLILLIALLFCVLLFIAFWCLETYHSTEDKVSTTTVFPKHVFLTLPPSKLAHRKLYQSNTFVQMLHNTHLGSNRSSCWVCGLLPAETQHGMPFVPMPFSLNGSGFAWMELFWENIWRRVEKSWNREVCPDMGEITGSFEYKERICPDAMKIYYTFIWHAYYMNVWFNGTEEENMEFKRFNVTSRITVFTTRNVSKDEVIPLKVLPNFAPFCIEGVGTIPVGNSSCEVVITLSTTASPPFIASPNTYFVCGHNAYVWLPYGWTGRCYIAFLLPPTYLAPSNYDRIFHLHKREVVDQTDTVGEIAGDVFKGMLPFWGPMLNSREIRRLTRIVEATLNATAGALENITVELQATRLVTLQNRMALDIILANKGGVCRIIGSSCCTYIPDNVPNVKLAIEKLHQIASEAHEEIGTWSFSNWSWNLLMSWGWKLLMILIAIGGIIMSCCLCIQCMPVCCGLVSSSCQSVLTSLCGKFKKSSQKIEANNLRNIDPSIFSP